MAPAIADRGQRDQRGGRSGALAACAGMAEARADDEQELPGQRIEEPHPVIGIGVQRPAAREVRA